jgi:hypothetical protein
MAQNPYDFYSPEAIQARNAKRQGQTPAPQAKPVAPQATPVVKEPGMIDKFLEFFTTPLTKHSPPVNDALNSIASPEQDEVTPTTHVGAPTKGNPKGMAVGGGLNVNPLDPSTILTALKPWLVGGVEGATTPATIAEAATLKGGGAVLKAGLKARAAGNTTRQAINKAPEVISAIKDMSRLGGHGVAIGSNVALGTQGAHTALIDEDATTGERLLGAAQAVGGFGAGGAGYLSRRAENIVRSTPSPNTGGRLVPGGEKTQAITLPTDAPPPIVREAVQKARAASTPSGLAVKAGEGKDATIILDPLDEVDSAIKNASDIAKAQRTASDAGDKSFLKRKQAVAKAEDQAWTMVGKEKVQTEKAQGVHQKEQDKLVRAADAAYAEDAARTRVDSLKEGLESKGVSVSEGSSYKEDGVTHSATERFGPKAPEKPPVDESGGGPKPKPEKPKGPFIGGERPGKADDNRNRFFKDKLVAIERAMNRGGNWDVRLHERTGLYEIFENPELAIKPHTVVGPDDPIVPVIIPKEGPKARAFSEGEEKGIEEVGKIIDSHGGEIPASMQKPGQGAPLTPEELAKAQQIIDAQKNAPNIKGDLDPPDPPASPTPTKKKGPKGPKGGSGAAGLPVATKTGAKGAKAEVEGQLVDQLVDVADQNGGLKVSPDPLKSAMKGAARGDAYTPEEWKAFEQIQAELDASEFVPRRWHKDGEGKPLVEKSFRGKRIAHEAEAPFTPSTGGAPVFHELGAKTRAHAAKALADFKAGKTNAVGERAMAIARTRLQGQKVAGMSDVEMEAAMNASSSSMPDIKPRYAQPVASKAGKASESGPQSVPKVDVPDSIPSPKTTDTSDSGVIPISDVKKSKIDILSEHRRALDAEAKVKGEGSIPKEFKDSPESGLGPAPIKQGARLAGKGGFKLGQAKKIAQENEAFAASFEAMTPEQRRAYMKLLVQKEGNYPGAGDELSPEDLLKELHANNAKMQELHFNSQTMSEARGELPAYEAAQKEISRLALRNRAINETLNNLEGKSNYPGAGDETPPGLFDDILDTGEVQPRLPGAESVRDAEVKTPEMEAPFSLTPPDGPKPKKVKGPSLFDRMNEKGVESNELGIRTGLSIAGGLGGRHVGESDENDSIDPLTGMVGGAIAGFTSPDTARKLIQLANESGTDDAIATAAQSIKDTISKYSNIIPDYYRFALLANIPNLPINALVGPWGSAVMTALEYTASGDIRGLKALGKLANIPNFLKKWALADEATSLIEQAHSRGETSEALEAVHPWVKKVLSTPGEYMTRGDIAARDMLMEAGLDIDQARAGTLTDEPALGLTRMVRSGIQGAQTEGGKTSIAAKMALPFHKTLLNQFEGGLERTPIIGLFAQLSKDKPDPRRLIAAQQLLGGGVLYSAFQLGASTPYDNAETPLMTKLISNAGGQYGGIAAAAFLAGQAYGGGLTDEIGALKRFGREMVNSYTLPDARAFLDLIDSGEGVLKVATGQEPVPTIPEFIENAKPGIIPQVLKWDQVKEKTGVLQDMVLRNFRNRNQEAPDTLLDDIPDTFLDATQ